MRAADKRGLVLGPFTGECTQEIIAWVPYLRDRLGNERLKKCVAISRGGTDSWYPCKVLNAYDVVPPEEFRELLMKRKKSVGMVRNEKWDALDNLIMDRFGLKSDIHPMKMWNLKQNRLKGWFEPHAPVEPFPGLPEKYIAVRLYKNDWFQSALVVEATDEDAKIVKPLCPEIAFESDLPTVGLRLRTPADNHREIDFDCDITVHYEPHKSLEILSRVIAHAEKLVCPYGGLPFLGLASGIHVDAYSTHPAPHHSWHARRELEIAKACGGSLTTFVVRNGGWVGKCGK